MLGAVIGDIVGSQFERGNRVDGTCMKDYHFPLYTEKCRLTDDTVCTMAVMESLLYGTSRLSFKVSLLNWCRRYPNVGYGPAFKQWFASGDPQPYDSFGNGSAMRVSPVGAVRLDATKDIYSDHHPGINLVLRAAQESAECSHNHPEGIKGAQATAIAGCLASNGFSKEIIKDYIEKKFGYDLSTPLDEIRPTYGFDVSCQGSVPQAIRCFLESKDFVDCIRLAVSLGGDSDTQGAIAGGIAQAFYGKVPEQMVVETFARLPVHFVDVIMRFHEKFDISF